MNLGEVRSGNPSPVLRWGRWAHWTGAEHNEEPRPLLGPRPYAWMDRRGDSETRKVAKRELETLQGRREELEELERDRDILLEHYAGMVPEGLEDFDPEERR